MTFLNPFLLIGLLAASIPLLLHLLNLRRLRTVEFSSLRFLKELQKSRMRRLRLRQILLLVLRTLLVIFAVLAFARPALQGTSGLPGAHAAASVVILVDNSFSMDVQDQGGSRFALARAAAHDIIDLLGDNDEGWIVPMTDASRSTDRQSTRNRALLHVEIDSLALAYRRADLDLSLRIAASLLDRSESLNKEVYIITDGQRTNVSGSIDSMKLFGPETRVYIVPTSTSSGRGGANLGIDSVRVLSSLFDVGRPVDVRVWVHNFGPDDVENIGLSLFLNDERRGQVSASASAGKSAVIDISVTPRKPGPQAGYVELTADALTADNRRYFAFPVADRIKVALLGSAQALEFLSLAYSVLGPAIESRGLPPEGMGSVDLDDIATLVVADATVPDHARIADYVENGGGLVIFGGPGLDRNRFNGGLGAALGIALGETIVASATKDGSLEFGSVEREHPLFAGVFDPVSQGTSYDGPAIQQAVPAVGGEPIIRLRTGGSFMSEFRRGRGRVIYIAVPPTRAWSDFPARSMFLPIVVRSALYVGAQRDLYPSVTVGESVTIPIRAKGNPPTQARVTRPDGREEVVDVRTYPSGASIVYDETDARGTYVVRDGPRIVSLFSANVGHGESALAGMASQELEDYVAPRLSNPHMLRTLSGGGADFGDAVVEARFGLELWKYALILALLCAFAETIVARSALPR